MPETDKDHPDHWHNEVIADGHTHAHFHPVGLRTHEPDLSDPHKHHHVHRTAQPESMKYDGAVTIGL